MFKNNETVSPKENIHWSCDPFCFQVGQIILKVVEVWKVFIAASND